MAYTKRQFDGPYVICCPALPPQLPCDLSCRHSLALRALDHVIESPRLTDEAKLAALPTITLQFVHDTTLRFVREAFVTSFACGSVTSEMAASFCRQLTSFKTPSPESVFHHCFCTSDACPRSVFIEQLHLAAHAPSALPTSTPPSPLSLPSSGAGAFVPEDCLAIRCIQRLRVRLGMPSQARRIPLLKCHACS